MGWKLPTNFKILFPGINRDCMPIFRTWHQLFRLLLCDNIRNILYHSFTRHSPIITGELETSRGKSIHFSRLWQQYNVEWTCKGQYVRDWKEKFPLSFLPARSLLLRRAWVWYLRCHLMPFCVAADLWEQQFQRSVRARTTHYFQLALSGNTTRASTQWERAWESARGLMRRRQTDEINDGPLFQLRLHLSQDVNAR